MQQAGNFQNAATTKTWADVYGEARERFGGQMPGTALEQELIELYEQQPADVISAIEKLAGRYSEGKIRSPWPLLAREVREQPRREHVAPDVNADRERWV